MAEFAEIDQECAVSGERCAVSGEKTVRPEDGKTVRVGGSAAYRIPLDAQSKILYFRTEKSIESQEFNLQIMIGNFGMDQVKYYFCIF